MLVAQMKTRIQLGVSTEEDVVFGLYFLFDHKICQPLKSDQKNGLVS